MTELLPQSGHPPSRGQVYKIIFGKCCSIRPQQLSVPADDIKKATRLPELSSPGPKRTGKLSKKEKVLRNPSNSILLHPDDVEEDFLMERLFGREKTKRSKENYLKDKIGKGGGLSDREKDISFASKDKQHLGENVIKADSAKSSPHISEVECQDETEILHPPDLSAAPGEDEVAQKLSQVEAKNVHDVGSINGLHSIQEEHGSTKFPELSRPASQLGDEVASASSPSIEVEHRLTSLPLKQIVETRSSSSRSNDTPQTAYRIEGDITSGAENRKMGPILSTSILVEGELSQFVDITLEIYHGTSSSARVDLSNGFLCCNFLSEKENYRVLVRKKSSESKLILGKSSEGDYSSPEPLETKSFKITNSTLPEHLISRSDGDRPPTDDEWKQATVMVLTDDACPSLPEKPDSPNLVLLFLQRNPSLRSISESFFSAMPSLRVVDLSDSRIHTLPSSLFGLHELQVLILRNCSFMYRLPPEINGLEHIQVLDLLGTELESVPDELGQLTNLRHLQISFYGTDGERECDDLPPVLLSPETISKLQSLEALGIVVHPEDVRWVKNAEAIMQEIGTLEHLSYLRFYFPKIEIMEQFTESSSWRRIDTMKFKFVVGQDVKRIVDRVSSDIGNKFNEKDRSLRFVNGNEVPGAVKNVLNHVTAFYLDHHSAVGSLSEFGISNCSQLAFCVVRECPDIKEIISEKIDQEPAYPSLECLELHYLWELENICKNPLPEGSFFALKSLTVVTCPKLGYIFSKSLLQCYCNLEELIVEDCQSLKEIIEKSDEMDNDDFPARPRLRKVQLYYLPQLSRLLWEGRSLEVPFPLRRFQLESLTYHSCPELDLDLLRPLVTTIKEDNKHVI